MRFFSGRDAVRKKAAAALALGCFLIPSSALAWGRHGPYHPRAAHYYYYRGYDGDVALGVLGGVIGGVILDRLLTQPAPAAYYYPPPQGYPPAGGGGDPHERGYSEGFEEGYRSGSWERYEQGKRDGYREGVEAGRRGKRY